MEQLEIANCGFEVGGVRHAPYVFTEQGVAMLRSGTSVGAHNREAVRSRSDAEYVSKVEGALQELEETGYWPGLLADAGIYQPSTVAALHTEAGELTAILVTCAKKAKKRTRSEE
jgi:four helix bundle protein